MRYPAAETLPETTTEVERAERTITMREIRLNYTVIRSYLELSETMITTSLFRLSQQQFYTNTTFSPITERPFHHESGKGRSFIMVMFSLVCCASALASWRPFSHICRESGQKKQCETALPIAPV